jgi:hypothetical protein
MGDGDETFDDEEPALLQEVSEENISNESEAEEADN